MVQLPLKRKGNAGLALVGTFETQTPAQPFAMAANAYDDEIDQLASEDDFIEEEYDESAEFRIKNALSEPRYYSASTATLHGR